MLLGVLHDVCNAHGPGCGRTYTIVRAFTTHHYAPLLTYCGPRFSVRMANWRISLMFLIVLMLVLIPLSLSLVLTADISYPASSSHPSSPSRTSTIRSTLRPRTLLYLTPVALYLYALSYVPPPPGLPPSDIAGVALARLIVLGTLILGVLSGLGAMSYVWVHLVLFGRTRSVTSSCSPCDIG